MAFQGLSNLKKVARLLGVEYLILSNTNTPTGNGKVSIEELAAHLQLSNVGFNGEAKTTSMPISTDGYYIATEIGTYANFGGVKLLAGELGFIIQKNGTFTISKVQLTGQFIQNSEKGAPNGVATLDANGNLAQGITTGTSGNVVFQGSGTDLNPLEASLAVDGKVEEGNTQAVSGGEVFNKQHVINLSYNPITGGIPIYSSKVDARLAIPPSVFKRGLIFTYKITGDVHFTTEQYVGNSTNLEDASNEASFINLTNIPKIGRYDYNYVVPTFDRPSKILKIPVGVISVNDNRRINTTAAELTIPAGYSRLVASQGGVFSTVSVDSRLPINYGGELIYIATLKLEGSVLTVFNDDFPLNGHAIKKRDERISLVNNETNHINFDLPNRKIEFKGGAVIDTDLVGRISLPISDVEMPTGWSNCVVVYNRGTNTIQVRNQSDIPVDNSYVLFSYIYLGTLTGFTVNGLDNYCVNGVDHKKKNIYYNYLLSITDLIDYKSIPTMQPANGTGTEVNIQSTAQFNSDILYQWYEALRTSNTSNITRKLLGVTDSGYDVYSYKFSFGKMTLSTRSKPKIFITAGIHGGEVLGIYTTYKFFENIANSSDEFYITLRNNFDFVVMPCANPYALNVREVDGVFSVRWNHNGVDINRNADFKWHEFYDDTPGSQTYKGTAPFSEKESQFIRNEVEAEKSNLIMYIDFHNYTNIGTGVTEPYLTWFVSSNQMTYNSLCSFSDKIDFEVKDRYTYLPDNIRLSEVSKAWNDPMFKDYFSKKYNIFSIVFEVDNSCIYNSATDYNDADSVTRASEAFDNFIKNVSKDALDFYNRNLI